MPTRLASPCVALRCPALTALVKVFTEHVQTLAKMGKKQVVPEGLYDALIAVVDLLQKMVSICNNRCLYSSWSSVLSYSSSSSCG